MTKMKKKKNIAKHSNCWMDAEQLELSYIAGDVHSGK